jgi:hypothetical protein
MSGNRTTDVLTKDLAGSDRTLIVAYEETSSSD